MSAVILPDRGNHGLPVAATVGGGLVGQLRHEELPAVEGINLADEGAVEDLPRESDDDAARALAVEILVLEDKRVAVLVEQLYAADELEVLAVDGDLLSALDALALLLGIAGNDGRAEGQGQARLHFLVRGADDELAACSGDARRRGDPDHVIADNLEVGDLDAIGEYDLTDIREAGAVDGHLLSCNHFRREEHLDA